MLERKKNILTCTAVAESTRTPGEFRSIRTTPTWPDCAAKCSGVKQYCGCKAKNKPVVETKLLFD